MVRLGRRGMSPLIATVLLMAFAVALGGMIMNWGDRIVNDPIQMCENVNIVVGSFCTSDDGVHVQVRNDGEIALAALTVNVVHPDGTSFNSDVGNSVLGAGQRLQNTVSILVKPSDSVKLLAKVGQERDIQLCPEPLMSSTPLPDC